MGIGRPRTVTAGMTDEERAERKRKYFQNRTKFSTEISDPSTVKTCIKCKQKFPLKEFRKDPQRPDGRFPYCKQCCSKNPEKRAERIEKKALGLNFCSDCKDWKDRSLFYINLNNASGLHHQCKKCAAHRVMADYRAEPEKHREKARKYGRENQEKIRRANKKHYDEHIEESRERARLWYEKNGHKDREKSLERTRIWLKTDRGRVMSRASGHKRRAAMIGSYSPEEWELLLDLCGRICLRCGVTEKESIYAFRKIPKVGHLTVDHIIPVIKGGPNTIDNLQPLCMPCHIRKRDKAIDYRPFAARKQFPPPDGQEIIPPVKKKKKRKKVTLKACPFAGTEHDEKLCKTCKMRAKWRRRTDRKWEKIARGIISQ